MINIKYYNGQMNIEPSVFFPATQERCKKLVKVINMDFEHREDIIKDVITSLENLIDRGKYPNGVPIKKNDIKRLKKNLEFFKVMA